jgi:hypothetical protein
MTSRSSFLTLIRILCRRRDDGRRDCRFPFGSVLFCGLRSFAFALFTASRRRRAVCHPEAPLHFIFVRRRRREAGCRIFIVPFAVPRVFFALFVIKSASGWQTTQSCSSVCQCRVVFCDIRGSMVSRAINYSSLTFQPRAQISGLFHWLGRSGQVMLG